MRRILILIFTVVVLSVTVKGQDITDTPYIVYTDSADIYIKRERFTDAERCLLTALRSEPDNSSNYLLLSNLGIVRKKTGNIRGALEAFDAGIAMAPRSTVLRHNRAVTLMGINMRDEALADFEAALEVDSLSEEALCFSSMLYLEKSDSIKAKPLIARLIKFYPDNSTAYMLKGNLYLLSGGDIKGALPYFKEAIKREDSEEYYEIAIVNCLKDDMFEEGDELVAEALKKYPRYGNFYVLRAVSHKKKYQNDFAIMDLRLAKEWDADEDMLQLYLLLTAGK